MTIRHEFLGYSSLWSAEDVEGNHCGIICGTSQESVWRDWRKPQKHPKLSGELATCWKSNFDNATFAVFLSAVIYDSGQEYRQPLTPRRRPTPQETEIPTHGDLVKKYIWFLVIKSAFCSSSWSNLCLKWGIVFNRFWRFQLWAQICHKDKPYRIHLHNKVLFCTTLTQNTIHTEILLGFFTAFRQTSSQYLKSGHTAPFHIISSSLVTHRRIILCYIMSATVSDVKQIIQGRMFVWSARDVCESSKKALTLQSNFKPHLTNWFTARLTEVLVKIPENFLNWRHLNRKHLITLNFYLKKTCAVWTDERSKLDFGIGRHIK